MSADALLPCTRNLMRELEDLSGRPVATREDPALALLATIQPATADSPVHLILYRPGDSAPDYLIAYEIGFVLRMLARPPEERFALGADRGRRGEIIAEMQRRMPELDPTRAAELGALLFDSLMRQLRSYPIGMLVDLHLHHACPELRALQRASLLAQVQQNLHALSPEMLQKYPETIVQANRRMNAAYAIFVAGLLDQPHLVVPYRAIGLEASGTALLAGVTARPYDLIDDQALIRDWSRQLGIDDWITFLPLA
jgi:hypothetical protein